MQKSKRNIAVIAAFLVAVPVINGIYSLIPTPIVGFIMLISAAVIVISFISTKRHSPDWVPELCSDIRGIIIETNGRNYIISEDYYYSIDDNGFDGVMSYIESGIWHISDNSDAVDAPVEITVPHDNGPEFFNAELNRGNMFINSLHVKSAVFNAHTGHTEIHSLKAENLNVSAGHGKVDIDASINGNSSFICGDGSVNAMLNNNPNDFNISVQTGKGTVHVGKELFGEGNRNGNINNNAASDINVRCGLGNITINFGRGDEDE